MRSTLPLTGTERFFSESEIIVSKTDLGGRITYANDVFLRVAGFDEEEVLDKPHSLVRHPQMPRSVFKLMWDTLGSGAEIFAYVINRCKNGDHYWVLAHVTPTLNAKGDIISYHSNRRVATKSAVATVSEIYRALSDEEQKSQYSKEGMVSAGKLLNRMLVEKGCSYEELIFSLSQDSQ